MKSQKKELQQLVRQFLFANPHFSRIYPLLHNSSPAYIVGGVVRDLVMGRLPRDVDIITAKPVPAVMTSVGAKNSWGGYKIRCGLYSIDIWQMSSHWAVLQKFVIPEAEALQRAALFNVDGAVVGLTPDADTEVYYELLLEATKTERISPACDEAALWKNPTPYRNVAKAFWLMAKYRWGLAPELREYVASILVSEKDAPKKVYEEARRRYRRTDFLGDLINDMT
ncbi:MAG: hypothetical protein K6U87_14300 [Firmicutes bacterium]|nr:hypothetical protein [Bacillota bacterium]